MPFYTGIIVGKLAETKAFYTRHLGFSIKFENDWFLLLERDKRELAFMLPNLEFQHELFREESETWMILDLGK